jgi:hypothetical protein
MRNYKKIFIFFLTWRILLFIPLYFSAKFIPYRPHFEYTNLWYYTKPYWPVNSILIYPWANFDGVHYLSIAGRGYTDNGRFFPLYPLIVRLVTLLFHTKAFDAIQFFGGFLLSNLLLLASLFILYESVKADFSEKVALKTIVMLLLFPTSFFFGAIYTESLFLFLSLLAFYFIKKDNYRLTSIASFLLTLTRLVGIFIIPALLMMIISKKKVKTSLKSIVIPSLLICFSAIGLFIYSWYNKIKWGDWLYFLKAQGQLNNGRSTTTVVLFPQTLFRYFKIIFTVSVSYEWWIALLELLVFVTVFFLLYRAWKNKIDLAYIVFSLFCFFIPASSGTFSGLPRYVIILFPVFIALALVKNKYWQIAYIVISIIIGFVLLMFFSRGYYVA